MLVLFFVREESFTESIAFVLFYFDSLVKRSVARTMRLRKIDVVNEK
jgi:hypothetical protein